MMRRFFCALTCVAATAGCATGQSWDEADEAASADDGWVSLFDGETLDGWRGYNEAGLPGGWGVVDGLLTRTGPGGDIITEGQYADFEMTFEWMVEEAGNSGIFYRAAEGEEWIYHSAPEYQILDDANHYDGGNPLTSAGANYGLNAAPRGIVKPAGEWNTGRIVVDGNRVEHWLNGQMTVQYELHSEEWRQLVEGSKFVEWPAYGQAARGHIGLQDHGDPVFYRKMQIREIR